MAGMSERMPPNPTWSPRVNSYQLYALSGNDRQVSKRAGLSGDKEYDRNRCVLFAGSMRYLMAIFVISMLAGCRSPQVAFQSQVHQASNHQVGVSVKPSLRTQLAEYSIEELVQLGLAENPRLKEAAHKVQALKHRIPQALSLPDPMVNTVTHLSPVETAAGRQAFALGVSQKFVDVDRRATRAAMANDEVRAAESDLFRLRNELSEKIRTACYQLLAVRETIQITREDIASLAQIEEVVLRQYEVKKSVSQQDVLSVQVEQSRVENQLAELLQKEKSYAARLARLVHRGPTSTFNLSDSLKDPSHSGDVDALIAQAQNARPELAAQLARVQKSRRQIQLAHLQNKPDFTVGLNWIATSSEGISPVANGDDALLLGIGFNLPVYKSRIRAAACEAKESCLASESRLESLQDEIAEEVFDTVAKLESTASTLELLEEDIIPKTERTFELSIEEYAAAKTDFVPLIASWRSLLKYRIASANLQSQRMQLLATLGRQVGQMTPIGTGSIQLLPQSPSLEEETSLSAEDDSKATEEQKYGLLKSEPVTDSKN